MKDLVVLMKEQLDNGKTVSFVPRGKSMKPMLEGGKDMVMLRKTDVKLKKFDVALYYRRETDKYVIHRVVDFKSDGSYVMLGDNNFEKEYGIFDKDVVAVVTAFYHKGQMRNVNSIGYKLYCNFWHYSRPIRLFYVRLKSLFNV